MKLNRFKPWKEADSGCNVYGCSNNDIAMGSVELINVRKVINSFCAMIITKLNELLSHNR